jgi:hypothetical protein
VEGDPGAGLVRGPHGLEGALRLAAAVGLTPNLAVAADLELEALGERVHHRDPHAVEPARDLVGGVAELAAGVEGGHHDLGGGALLGGVLVDGDTATVVDHGDAAILMDHHRDLAAVARDGLVHGVVHHLVDEVVQAVGTGGPDVHCRPLPHRVEAFENLDRTRVVAQLGVVPERQPAALRGTGEGGATPARRG